MIYHIFIFVVNITAMLLAHGNKFKSVNSKSVVACNDGWKNLNGVSIYKYYSAYSPTVIESVYGAADIPDTLEPFITVLKSCERLYVTDGQHGIYTMISSGGEWQRKWIKL